MNRPKCGAPSRGCEWCNTDRTCVYLMEPCQHQLPLHFKNFDKQVQTNAWRNLLQQGLCEICGAKTVRKGVSNVKK